MGGLHALHNRLTVVGPRSPAERLLFLLLSGCAVLYRAVVTCRLAMYRRGWLGSYRSGVPVVSVGNLTVGGTGKTPIVDLLLRWALANDIRVAVVSRGYGGHPGTEALLVSDGSRLLVDDPALSGDEPQLLARRNPFALVIVAPRRTAGVRLAEQYGARLIILDDGFQHLAVTRDLDIVLLDSRNPFGNRRLLPAGILREPPDQLSRADLVIMTHAGPEGGTLPGFAEPVLRARHVLAGIAVDLEGKALPLAEFAGQPCLVFAGIAEPAGFFQALRRQGITPIAELALADHQVYTPAIVGQLVAAGQGAEFFLTTEKDAVKLDARLLPCPCYRVPLEIVVEPLSVLEEKLRHLLAGR